jgi:ion channel
VGPVSRPRALLERREQARDKFGLLLILLVSSFLALGFADETWARIVAGVLQLTAIFVGFLATGLRQEHRWLSLFAGVGIVAIVLSAVDNDIATGFSAVAGVVLLGALLIAILKRVLRHERVTIQTLYGAVCTYFLIGLMFSSVYGALNDLGNAPVFGEPVDRSVFSYFSFVTLTTVGYGDYTVATDIARRVAATEAVIGQVFIATTLARLVSLYKSSQR